MGASKGTKGPSGQKAGEPGGDTKTCGKKRPWMPEEDELLIQATERHGLRKWAQIAAELGRPNEAVRLRWQNVLNPDTKKSPFSEWEQAVIVLAQPHCSNQWSAIAALLPGRTPYAVKNHWYNTLSRKVAKDCVRNRHIWPGVTLEEVLEAQPPEALAAAGANGAAGGKGCDAAAAAGVLRALPGGAAPDAAGRPVAAQRASRRRQARLSAIKMEQLLGEMSEEEEEEDEDEGEDGGWGVPASKRSRDASPFAALPAAAATATTTTATSSGSGSSTFHSACIGIKEELGCAEEAQSCGRTYAATAAGGSGAAAGAMGPPAALFETSCSGSGMLRSASLLSHASCCTGGAASPEGHWQSLANDFFPICGDDGGCGGRGGQTDDASLLELVSGLGPLGMMGQAPLLGSAQGGTLSEPCQMGSLLLLPGEACAGGVATAAAVSGGSSGSCDGEDGSCRAFARVPSFSSGCTVLTPAGSRLAPLLPPATAEPTQRLQLSPGRCLLRGRPRNVYKPDIPPAAAGTPGTAAAPCSWGGLPSWSQPALSAAGDAPSACGRYTDASALLIGRNELAACGSAAGGLAADWDAPCLLMAGEACMPTACEGFGFSDPSLLPGLPGLPGLSGLPGLPGLDALYGL